MNSESSFSASPWSLIWSNYLQKPTQFSAKLAQTLQLASKAWQEHQFERTFCVFRQGTKPESKSSWRKEVWATETLSDKTRMTLFSRAFFSFLWDRPPWRSKWVTEIRFSCCFLQTRIAERSLDLFFLMTQITSFQFAGGLYKWVAAKSNKEPQRWRNVQTPDRGQRMFWKCHTSRDHKGKCT